MSKPGGKPAWSWAIYEADKRQDALKRQRAQAAKVKLANDAKAARAAKSLQQEEKTSDRTSIDPAGVQPIGQRSGGGNQNAHRAVDGLPARECARQPRAFDRADELRTSRNVGGEGELHLAAGDQTAAPYLRTADEAGGCEGRAPEGSRGIGAATQTSPPNARQPFIDLNNVPSAMDARAGVVRLSPKIALYPHGIGPCAPGKLWCKCGATLGNEGGLVPEWFGAGCIEQVCPLKSPTRKARHHAGA